MAKGKNKGTFHVLGPPPEEEARRNLLLEVFCSFLGPEEAAQQLDLLLNRFGSFKSILTAPEEELVLAGASEQTARFLRQSTELARAYLEEDAKSLKRIFDTKSACEVMRPKFLGRKMNLWQYCFSTAEAKYFIVTFWQRGRSVLCPSINADWWNCVSVIMCRPSSSPITIPAGWHVPPATILWLPGIFSCR